MILVFVLLGDTDGMAVMSSDVPVMPAAAQDAVNEHRDDGEQTGERGVHQTVLSETDSSWGANTRRNLIISP